MRECLGRCGSSRASEARAIERGLKEIEREIDAGRFRFDIGDEDIHLAIERRLIVKIGAAGRKLHTARSRNDQVALDFRLYLRDELREVIAIVGELRTALIRVARRHVETVMPGYTHLQRAQPVSLAHHLLAYVEMLDARRRTLCAGSGAHRRDAARRGCAGRDHAADRSRDGCARAWVCANYRQQYRCGFGSRLSRSISCPPPRCSSVHLSRMSEELILWTSSEFGFASIPDEFSTGSSMMPQKKNPDLAELIRGKSGRVIGDLIAMLTILKGLPLAYNSDLQEDKERVFDALDTIKPATRLMAKLWPDIRFDRAAMRAAAGGFALATDLAEYLVEKGVAFREAHEIVGRIVRETAASGATLEDLEHRDLRRYSEAFKADAAGILRAENSLARRSVAGGPAPDTVRRRLKEFKR